MRLSINSKSRATLLGLAIVATLFAGRDAAAEKTWYTRATLLKEFFAASDRVSYKQFTLDATQRATLKKKLGYEVPARVTVYYGVTGARVDGYAYIDDEMGQHEPITYGTLTGPDGRMRRLEVLVYREAYGDEVREKRFRRQFEGKTAADPCRHGQDIVAISGATISSKAMAVGVRRALVLVDELIVRPHVSLTSSR